MFDKAWRGLEAQGWRKAVGASGCEYCIVMDGAVLRCAWGHVDPEGTGNRRGYVSELRDTGRGLAATLDAWQLMFAEALQRAHDQSDAGQDMRWAMEALARMYQLTVPR